MLPKSADHDLMRTGEDARGCGQCRGEPKDDGFPFSECIFEAQEEDYDPRRGGGAEAHARVASSVPGARTLP